MKKSEPRSVTGLLEELFKKKDSPLSEGYFLCQLIRVWKQLAGSSFADVAKPIQFSRHELTLALPSSAHIQEIQFAKETLRKKINEHFPNQKVNRIKLKIKNSDFIEKKWADKIF